MKLRQDSAGALRKGWPGCSETKAELVKYLRDSFDYGDRVLATINAQTLWPCRGALRRAEYALGCGRGGVA